MCWETQNERQKAVDMAGNEGTVMNEPFKELLAQAAEERKVVQFTLRSGKWEMRLEKDIEDMTLPELEDYLAELESQLSTMDGGSRGSGRPH
jgi:hypothetical protein